jgi:hypothetical protein
MFVERMAKVFPFPNNVASNRQEILNEEKFTQADEPNSHQQK